jgi:L-rhamnose mutarotase
MKPACAAIGSVGVVLAASLGSVLADFAGARPAPQRHAWITGLKPEMAARYRELHAHPWPSVNRMLKECHIENFSIWQREIEGKLYLFAYLEYAGSDFAADMKKMASDPETQRWWRETDPCQLPLPDAASQGKTWSDMAEVYYLP